VSTAEGADLRSMREKVERLIDQWKAAWDQVGERMGPLLILDEESPETAIPLAQCNAIASELCKAIVALTLEVKLESGPVRYRGKLYHPILGEDGEPESVIEIDPSEAVDLDDPFADWL
jgi:hypothetical protein